MTVLCVLVTRGVFVLTTWLSLDSLRKMDDVLRVVVTMQNVFSLTKRDDLPILVGPWSHGRGPPRPSRKAQQRTKVSEWWEVHTRHATDTGPWTPIYRENKRSTIVERFKQRKLFSPKDMDSRIVHVVRYALVKG